MAYASWTKIGGSMLLAIRALAQAEGVDAALVQEWAISQPGLVSRSEHTAAAVGPKAWRFIGEMAQIAESYQAVGLPDGFAEAALGIYEDLAEFKGSVSPELGEVIGRLLVSE